MVPAMNRTLKTLLLVSMMGILSAASPNADVKREQEYSDRLRKAQREYIRIMDELDRWCASHGQKVGPKGAQGDVGCVAATTQTPSTPTKPEERK